MSAGARWVDAGPSADLAPGAARLFNGGDDPVALGPHEDGVHLDRCHVEAVDRQDACGAAGAEADVQQPAAVWPQNRQKLDELPRPEQ